MRQGCFLDTGIGRVYTQTVTRGRAVAARRAHNPEVVGSNPTPATNFPLQSIHNIPYYLVGSLFRFYRFVRMPDNTMSAGNNDIAFANHILIFVPDSHYLQEIGTIFS